LFGKLNVLVRFNKPLERHRFLGFLKRFTGFAMERVIP